MPSKRFLQPLFLLERFDRRVQGLDERERSEGRVSREFDFASNAVHADGKLLREVFFNVLQIVILDDLHQFVDVFVQGIQRLGDFLVVVLVVELLELFGLSEDQGPVTVTTNHLLERSSGAVAVLLEARTHFVGQFLVTLFQIREFTNGMTNAVAESRIRREFGNVLGKRTNDAFDDVVGAFLCTSQRFEIFQIGNAQTFRHLSTVLHDVCVRRLIDVANHLGNGTKLGADASLVLLETVGDGEPSLLIQVAKVRLDGVTLAIAEARIGHHVGEQSVHATTNQIFIGVLDEAGQDESVHYLLAYKKASRTGRQKFKQMSYVLTF